MSNQKAQLTAALDELRAQALEMALNTPPQVTAKLRQNAALHPSKYDFNSEIELKYRLDVNDVSAYSDAATLIDQMRAMRQSISNLEFVEAQGAGPHNTVKVSDESEFDY